MIPAPFNESPSAMPYLVISAMCYGMYPPYAVNAALIGMLQNAGVPGYCLYDFRIRAKAVVSNLPKGNT